MATDIVGSKEPSLPTGAYTKDRGAHGQNGPQPSSLQGTTVNYAGGVRQLIPALDISPPKGDAVLAAIVAKGVKGQMSSAASNDQATLDKRGRGAPSPVKDSMHANDGSPSGKV